MTQTRAEQYAELLETCSIMKHDKDVAKELRRLSPMEARVKELEGILHDFKSRINDCRNLPLNASEVFDSFYEECIDEALAQTSGPNHG